MESVDRNERWSELMKKAQAGDASAYQTLLTEIRGAIHGFCESRVGYLGISEDVVQDSLLAIHRFRHTYDPARPFTPWMYSIVRHKMIDCFRRKTAVMQQEEQSPELLEQAPAPESAEDASLSEGLAAAVAGLPEKYRQALTLVKIEGKPVAEAAAALGISQSNLKVRLSRAYQMIRKKLEGET